MAGILVDRYRLTITLRSASSWSSQALRTGYEKQIADLKLDFQSRIDQV